MIWSALWLSLLVTTVAALFIFVIGLAVALLLARFHFTGKLFVETVVFLPLILPPSVLGYFLLLVLGNGNPFVRWFEVQILFTWQAAAVASAIVGLPLMIASARAGIAGVDPLLENAARTLGATHFTVWRRVTLPLARSGILAGFVLGTARALGEFGATLMIAGNIPGATQTLPLALYDALQARRYSDANQMVVIITVFCVIGLLAVRRLEARR